MIAKAAFTYLTESAQRAAEESKKFAETERSAADNTRNKNKSLDELISKYKTISLSADDDVTKRTQISEIQQQINKLIGAEASDLNLVNGNLQTQLDLWKGINNERMEAQYSDDWDAASASGQSAKDYIYHNAPKQFGIDFNDWGAGSNEYSFVLGDEDKDQLKKIIDIIEKTNGVDTTSHQVDSLVPTEEPWIRITLTGDFNAAEYKKNFHEILENLQRAGYDTSNSDTYGKIAQAYESIFGEDSEYQKSFEAYQTALEDTIKLDSEAQSAQSATISSLSEYLELRKKIIDSVGKNEKVSGAQNAGWLSDKDIGMRVDEFLSQFSNLSSYYVANSVADILSRLRNEISDDKSLSEFDEWVNGLTDKDKELIVKISSEYSSDKVREQLEGYSKGGSVDLLVRPVIDQSELGKAGWTDEDGKPLSEGSGTTLTSTYSINEGTPKG